MHMNSYLKSTDDLLHLGTPKIQEALNQIPVDESCGLLCLTLCVEGPPGAAQSRKKSIQGCSIAGGSHFRYNYDTFNLRRTQQIFRVVWRKSRKATVLRGQLVLSLNQDEGFVLLTLENCCINCSLTRLDCKTYLFFKRIIQNASNLSGLDVRSHLNPLHII